MKIQQITLYDGKPLDQYPIFPGTFRSGDPCVNGLRCKSEDGEETQVVFSRSGNSIIFLEIDQTGVITDSYIHALGKEGYSWTLADVANLLVDNYTIPLGDWEVIQGKF